MRCCNRRVKFVMMPHCILNRDICITMSHSKYIQSELSLNIGMVGGIISSVFMYSHIFLQLVLQIVIQIVIEQRVSL